MNATEGGACALGSLRLFLYRKRQLVESGHKVSPVQAAPGRVTGQVPGAELFRKAELFRLLQEKGGTEIGAFRHIDPAERLRRIKPRWLRHERRGLGAGKVCNVPTQCLKAATLRKARQEPVEISRGVKGRDVRMELMLDLKKQPISLTAPEGVGAHDPLIEFPMGGVRPGLEPLDPGLGEGWAIDIHGPHIGPPTQTVKCCCDPRGGADRGTFSTCRHAAET